MQIFTRRNEGSGRDLNDVRLKGQATRNGSVARQTTSTRFCVVRSPAISQSSSQPSSGSSSFAAQHESGFGPEPTSRDVRYSVAMRGKADIGWTLLLTQG
jgi:hypothetical protein